MQMKVRSMTVTLMRWFYKKQNLLFFYVAVEGNPVPLIFCSFSSTIYSFAGNPVINSIRWISWKKSWHLIRQFIVVYSEKIISKEIFALHKKWSFPSRISLLKKSVMKNFIFFAVLTKKSSINQLLHNEKLKLVYAVYYCINVYNVTKPFLHLPEETVLKKQVLKSK